MLFLITKKQKDKILDEYYSYLINIFTISVIILLIIFITSLFPTYLTMKIDKQILNDKLVPLQAEIDKNKTISVEKNSLSINDDISILSSSSTNKNTVNIYNEIKTIYESVPNVGILSINVDTLSKKVAIVANIDNKNTANALVDKLNSSRYKGAELPYSVFTQSKSFVFNQNLNYE
jgi:hypothetical protein